MTRRLTNTQRRRLERIKDTAIDIGNGVKAFTSTDKLAKLVARMDVTSVADGYRTSTALGDKTSGSGSSSTPTESGALSRMGKPPKDEVSDAYHRIERNLKKAEFLVADAAGILSYISKIVEDTKGRVTTTPCEICKELPAQKAGWCDSCRTEWRLHGKPDRTRWVFWKNEVRASERAIRQYEVKDAQGNIVTQEILGPKDALLVTECPPPTGPCFAGPHYHAT